MRRIFSAMIAVVLTQSCVFAQKLGNDRNLAQEAACRASGVFKSYKVKNATDGILSDGSRWCAELGNTTRLLIFRLLVRAGKDGLPVGEIQRNLGIPGSTLSHHIQRLVHVGLVNQRRDSRVLYCEPQFEAVRELADYLVSECCSLQTQLDPKTVD